MLIRKLFFIVIILFSVDAGSNNIPQKFVGDWDIKVISQEGFPWWHQVKHPVKLSITNDEIYLVDQFDYKCRLHKYIYDSELDSFIFSHCGVGNKSDKAFEIIHVLTISDDGLLKGTVRNYKVLFKWEGVKKQ